MVSPYTLKEKKMIKFRELKQNKGKKKEAEIKKPFSNAYMFALGSLSSMWTELVVLFHRTTPVLVFCRKAFRQGWSRCKDGWTRDASTPSRKRWGDKGQYGIPKIWGRVWEAFRCDRDEVEGRNTITHIYIFPFLQNKL